MRSLAGDLTLLLFSLGIIGTGLLAVPVLAGRRDTMGEHVIGRRLRWLGWAATTAMAITVGAMLVVL